MREVYHIERLIDGAYVYVDIKLGSLKEAEDELKYLRGLSYIRQEQGAKYRVVQVWELEEEPIYANDWM